MLPSALACEVHVLLIAEHYFQPKIQNSSEFLSALEQTFTIVHFIS